MNKILPGVVITIFLLTAAGPGFGQQTHLMFAEGELAGDNVILEQFDTAEDFASGTAIVTKNDKTGMIDKTGQYLLDLEYDAISRSPGPGLFKVCKGWSYGLFSIEQGMILPVEFSDFTLYPDGIIVAWKDGKQGIFDANGKLLLPITGARISSIGEGYMLISDEDLLSIYDTRHKKLIPTSYKSINKFHNELAAFQARNDSWGFLDPALKPVIPARYSWVTDFSWYQAAVEDETGISIINNFGKPAPHPRVTQDAFFRYPEWRLASFNGRYGVMDALGVWLIRPEYQDIRDFSTGILLIKKGFTWSVHYPENPTAGNQIFDDVGYIFDDRCWAMSGMKYSFLNEKGRLITPLQYDSVENMRNGMAAVKKNRLWGFIDAQGRQLQPHIFSYIVYEGNGNYTVYEGERIGVVTSAGEFLPVELETLPAENPIQY